MEKRMESAEYVLPGHPDKLCDALVDDIVHAVRKIDESGQCGLEAAVVFNSVYLTGRLAMNAEPKLMMNERILKDIIRRSWQDAGYGTDAAGYEWGPTAESLEITTNLCLGRFEPGERELRHLSDDQAICIGYALDSPETDYLPPAHWLAHKIAQRLYELRRERGAGEMGPDGKVIVQVERDGKEWRPTATSLSLNHHEGSNWMLLRSIAEQAVEESIGGKPLPKIILNGAGNFVSGGPNGDNGLSGKKLVVDAYGPTIPIGGGAWSGKDLRKVDRLGGMLARELALEAVRSGDAREVLVRLSYYPGSDRPAQIEAFLDNRLVDTAAFLKKVGDPDLENLTVWNRYKMYRHPLSRFARWGHLFARKTEGVPWGV